MLSWLKRRAPRAPAVEAAQEARPRASELMEAAHASRARGDWSEAESLARTALEIEHDCVDAHLLLGELCQSRGEHEDAQDSYLLASCFAPESPEPKFRMGLALLDAGNTARAETMLREALALDPQHARAQNALGAALLHLERLAEARACLERAVALKPDFVEAHSNLGYLLYRDFEEFERGEWHIRRALELAPGNVDVLTNLSMIMRGQPEEVIALADELLKPGAGAELDSVRLNRALALLKLGRFEQGWEDYEARKSVRCNYVQRAMPWPEWDGGSLAGRTIYVHTEQGLGDEIMFASCLPELTALAGRCIVECSPKLTKLFRRSFQAEVIAKPERDGPAQGLSRDVDCFIALGSLPRSFRTSWSAFPRHDGYLRADAERVAAWRQRLATLPGTLKVGIAWRGGMASTQRSLRSMAVEQYLPFLRTPGVDFIDMQHFDCTDELAALRAQHGVVVHRWSDAHEDYDETAALVAALDVVVSVQTALVHLSGALGKETLALIAAAPEWRYLSNGERMPWYPAVRLLRQEASGDWAAPVAEVAKCLAERVTLDRA